MAKREGWNKRRLESLCSLRTTLFHHFHELSRSASTVTEQAKYRSVDRLRVVLESITHGPMSITSSRSVSPCPSETFSYDIFLPNAELGVAEMSSTPPSRTPSESFSRTSST